MDTETLIEVVASDGSQLVFTKLDTSKITFNYSEVSDLDFDEIAPTQIIGIDDPKNLYHLYEGNSKFAIPKSSGFTRLYTYNSPSSKTTGNIGSIFSIIKNLTQNEIYLDTTCGIKYKAYNLCMELIDQDDITTLCIEDKDEIEIPVNMVSSIFFDDNFEVFFLAYTGNAETVTIKNTRKHKKIHIYTGELDDQFGKGYDPLGSILNTYIGNLMDIDDTPEHMWCGEGEECGIDDQENDLMAFASTNFEELQKELFSDE